MKILKKYLIFASLFIIISLSAKQMGKKVAYPTGSNQPATQPITQSQKPYMQPKRAPTFSELVHTIKNKHTNVWNNSTKLLHTVFINDLVSDARAAELTQDQLGILLTIARDSHAQFTGNNDQDAQILTNINNQISNAVDSL